LNKYQILLLTMLNKSLKGYINMESIIEVKNKKDLEELLIMLTVNNIQFSSTIYDINKGATISIWVR
jgi:hypothetical protein